MVMRPTPAETISGIRRILRDVVEPEVGSEYARARLREVRAVLAQIDWDNAGIRLNQDALALQALLRDCHAWISADPDRRAHFAAPSERLEYVLADAPPGAPEDFSHCSERRHRQDEAVTALVGPLEYWLEAHPDDREGQALRRRLIAYYTR
jgi:hypothetical protein